LEWDGELIWGSGEDTVFAIIREGEVVHRWAAPNPTTNNIAYDPEEQILWLSGITSDIKAYDREGNYLDRTIDLQGLRMYGLAWFAANPDSSFLYALNTPNADTTRFNKFNPQTGEMQFVTIIHRDSASTFSSAFICRNFDKYQGSVLMTVANIASDFGGDQLRVIQLQPNTEWLRVSPESGEIPAGEETEVEVSISTVSRDHSWAFEVGEYEGEIVFTHNGFGGQTILPVNLTVAEPDQVTQDGLGCPSSFELFAAYPNPFNSTTRIRFSLPSSGQVSLILYSLSGREVARLVDGVLQPGIYSVEVNAKDMPSGLYFVQLKVSDQLFTQKVMLIR